MGRYYSTSNGRSGKFMFGVQSSTDPEYLGMHEDPTYIQYYASDESVDKIKSMLDKQYDILGVREEDRIYDMPRDNNGNDAMKKYDNWENTVLYDKVWRDMKADQVDRKGKVLWSSRKGGDWVAVEIADGRTLALARIRLALNILADIKDDGYCSLEAET